jgi:hypothetical protein
MSYPCSGDKKSCASGHNPHRPDYASQEFEHEQDSSGARMSTGVSKEANVPRRDSAVSRRLFFLDVAAGRVMSVNPDGSDLKVQPGA